MVDDTIPPIRRDFYVYVIFRLDGSPCYVGKGCGGRWKRHNRKSSNSHLSRIIAKSLSPLPVVLLRTALTNQHAMEIEAAFISAIGRGKNGPLVNMTDGGEGTAGYRWSDSDKAKLKDFWESALGAEAKIALSLRGKAQMSGPEQLQALCARNIGNKYSLGRPMPNHVRLALSSSVSTSNATRKTTDNTRALRSAKMKAMWADPDTRVRMQTGQKKYALNNLDKFRAATPARGSDGRFVEQVTDNDTWSGDSVHGVGGQLPPT